MVSNILTLPVYLPIALDSATSQLQDAFLDFTHTSLSFLLPSSIPHSDYHVTLLISNVQFSIGLSSLSILSSGL